MAAYLTLVEFKLASSCPPELVDALETRQPGWVARQLELKSAWIDSRLQKRYATPFESPTPLAVVSWLAAIVTKICFLRRGVDPSDEQFKEIAREAAQAEKDITEAANSADGLFELPLRANTTDGGITRGGPRAQHQTSPYAWRDEQRRKGREEDQCR